MKLGPAPERGPTRGVAVALLALLLATPGPALAYIDPGSGSLLLQALLAGLLALGMTLRLTWRKLQSLLRGLFARDREDDEAMDP